MKAVLTEKLLLLLIIYLFSGEYSISVLVHKIHWCTNETKAIIVSPIFQLLFIGGAILETFGIFSLHMLFLFQYIVKYIKRTWETKDECLK